MAIGDDGKEARMIYRICRTFEVESGHQLAKHPEHCRFPHGHSRLVEVVLAAERLDARDMVCDFFVVKRAAREVIATFDHALCVNTRDPMYVTLRQAYGARVIPFDNEDPTSEVVARVLFERISANLAAYARNPAADYPLNADVRLERVRVWETPHGWAEYGVA
jgi:6-pyruvoyltetrahydropterin/6-carboxytetrahydropterin synthase